jgi:hypothetical protein
MEEKRCRNCEDLFWPDSHNATRQEYCLKPRCRMASKANSQKRWKKKPENRNYFSGPINVQRVQQWRKEHPGYWRKKSEKAVSALQETLNQQSTENTDETDLPLDALQDILSAQHIVLLGLIANLTGSALQDDIGNHLASQLHSPDISLTGIELSFEPDYCNRAMVTSRIAKPVPSEKISEVKMLLNLSLFNNSISGQGFSSRSRGSQR